MEGSTRSSIEPPGRPRMSDCLRLGLEGIIAHKMRSALAALGIVIGVAATIAVVTVMQSLTASLNRQFEGLGSRTLTVYPYTTLDDILRGRTHRLRLADLDLIRRRVEGIGDIAPRVGVGSPFGDVHARGVSTRTRIFGTTAAYADVHRTFPSTGRFLTHDDDASRRRVVVLGEQVRQDLKLPEQAVGQFVTIAGDWFKVVGVMEPRGDLFGMSQDNYVLIPYGTAISLDAGRPPQDLVVAFNVAEEKLVDETRDRVLDLLRRAHGLKAGQDNDFKVETANQLRSSYEVLSKKVTAALAAVVGISLLVAGIGIMNIMFVSVTERTREIGIAKALGARDSFILLQFLFEAGLLALLGGLAGAAVGLLAGHGLTGLVPDGERAWAPWWATVLPLGSCLVVGVVFGIIPANKAASILPIEALRYE
jgi:putative ABC transport system permease protein